MRFLKSSVLAIAVGALALSISAQRETTGKPQTQGIQNGQMQSGQMMQQGQMCIREMMWNCRRKMQSMMGSMMQSNDQVKKHIEAAKESNDPARMRAALDEAEKLLNSVDDDTNTRLNMMQGARGMCGMMSDQSGPKPQENKP